MSIIMFLSSREKPMCDQLFIAGGYMISRVRENLGEMITVKLLLNSHSLQVRISYMRKLYLKKAYHDMKKDVQKKKKFEKCQTVYLFKRLVRLQRFLNLCIVTRCAAVNITQSRVEKRDQGRSTALDTRHTRISNRTLFS